MEYLENNLRAVLSTTAASQWLNLRLQFIGVIIVSGVAFIALIQREFDDINAGIKSRRTNKTLCFNRIHYFLILYHYISVHQIYCSN